MPYTPEVAKMENPLVIIGEEDAVSGFIALGFKVYFAKDALEFSQALNEIVQGQAAVCLIQDILYRQGEERLRDFKQLPFPIFIPFAKADKTLILDSLIKDIRRKATGKI